MHLAPREVEMYMPCYVYLAQETLLQGVTRQFGSWSVPLGNEEYAELLKWTFRSYLPRAVAKGNAALIELYKDVSGVKSSYTSLIVRQIKEDYNVAHLCFFDCFASYILVCLAISPRDSGPRNYSTFH
jgi:hypothetical protein